MVAPTAEGVSGLFSSLSGASRAIADAASGPVPAAWLLAISGGGSALQHFYDVSDSIGTAESLAAVCGAQAVAGATIIPFMPLSPLLDPNSSTIGIDCPDSWSGSALLPGSSLYEDIAANITNPGAVLQATYLPLDASPRSAVIPLLTHSHDQGLAALPGGPMNGGLARRVYARPGAGTEVDAGVEDQARKTANAMARTADQSCGLHRLHGINANAARVEEVRGAVTTAWGMCGPRAIGLADATDEIGADGLFESI